MPLPIDFARPRAIAPQTQGGQEIDTAASILGDAVSQGFRTLSHDRSTSAATQLYPKADFQRVRDEDIEATNSAEKP